MDRDSLFIVNRGDGITIEFYCDDTCNRNKIEYLPSLFVNEGLTIELGYEDNIPIGLPLASTMKMTLDAYMIDVEQAMIGKWIEENSSPNAKKPNLWIVKRDGNIIFAGLQQPKDNEKYDLIKGEVEIQAIGIQKTIFETVRIENVISASPTDSDLIDYGLIHDYDNRNIVSYQTIPNSRIKFKKLWDFINACFGEIEQKYQYYMRNYDATCTYTWYNKPVFFEANNLVSTELSTELSVEPYIISHIFNNNDNALVPFTGAIPELQNKYTQLWNFFDALLKGWGYLANYKFVGNNLVYRISPINSQLFYDSLNDDDVTSEKRELNKKILNLRLSNARINKVRDEDVKVVTEVINSTSLTGNTSEATCIFGNEPNTVATHKAGNPKTAYSAFDINKSEKPPVFGIYYKMPEWVYPSIKVSEHFQLEEDYNGTFNYSFQSVNGRDNYNAGVKDTQRKCIASKAQKIRNTYLTSKSTQDVLTVSVSRDRIGMANIGNRYELNFTNIYSTLPFYQHIRFGTVAMLGRVVDELKNDYVECSFFFHGE